MKKLFLLAALALPLSVSLTGCNGGTSGLNIGGSTPYENAYRVELTSVGYEADDKGKITIPSVTAKLTAMAGAPDVNELTYTGTLLNSEKQPAVDANSFMLAKQYGTLLTGAKGGYRCTTTVEAQCTYNSPDAVMNTNGSWAVNTVTRSIYPGEWASAHLTATNYRPATSTGESAQWYVKMDYTANMSNGKSVSWTQFYPFLIPVKSQ